MTTMDRAGGALDALKRWLVGVNDRFGEHYAGIQAKVKAMLDGPVKRLVVDDGVPLAIGLSVWDTKIGPAPLLLAGEQSLAAKIDDKAMAESTKMIDVLEAGKTCDVTVAGMRRLMVKFGIDAPGTRGGELLFLLAIHAEPGTWLPADLLLDMLVQAGATLRDEAQLAAEAQAMPAAFDVVYSKWKVVLFQLRDTAAMLREKALAALAATAGPVEPVPLLAPPPARPGVHVDVPGVPLAAAPVAPALGSLPVDDGDGGDGVQPSLDERLWEEVHQHEKAAAVAAAVAGHPRSRSSCGSCRSRITWKTWAS